MKTFFTVTFLLISSFFFLQENWKLIYKNDTEDSIVKGELTELIAAIQNGLNVRIYFISRIYPDQIENDSQYTISYS